MNRSQQAEAPMRSIVLSVVLIASLILGGCTGDTPTPGMSPIPTISPAPLPHVSALDIVSAFMDAGIPAAKPIEYTAYNDPEQLLGQPHQYVQKVSWDDMRINIGVDPYAHTTIEVFSDPADAKARLEALIATAKDSPAIQTHNSVNGIYLMRLSLEFTLEQAKEYEAVFLAITNRKPTSA